MRVLSVHLLWFILLRVFSFTRLSFLLFSVFNNTSFLLSFSIFSSPSLPLNVCFYFDYFSLRFITVVLIISTIIIVYSYNYISPYSKPYYFLWLTVLFVLSILIVIIMPNLFFAMLGWDGLGLVSFFLIVYYQNQSSIVSGVFTLLMNRLGDRFFLCRLMLLFYSFTDFTYFSSDLMPSLLLLFLTITFITKSALYPFSPWLPIAMAAPTPISALVHSSTLVTAGLYLMIRYHYVLYESSHLIRCLFVVRVFTSFYAGLNAVFETDFKKLIALSTLSHLGFIAIAFSAGLLHLRFFHLLVHALFKSLLFITIGDIMINLNHSQDSRYLSSGFIYTPFSCFIMSVSLVNLLGLPSLRGFFSKDLVLETLSFSHLSLIIEIILYLNVIFTYYYTYKLFYYSFSPNKLNPYQLFHSVEFLHYFCMLVLGSITLIFGNLFINSVFPFILFYPMPYRLKFLPLFLNSAMFIVLFLLLVLPTLKTKFSSSFFSSMLFLRNIAMTLSSNAYYSILFNSVKSIELGFLNFTINTQAPQPTKSLSSVLLLTLFKIQSATYLACFIFLFIAFVSFLVY